VQYAQPIEQLIGKFPYRFLHLTVTKDLPEEVLGLSYNEFIAIRDDSVEPYVIVHEITHSTLYGIFPTWFEEGLAHFTEYHLTSTLAAGKAEMSSELRSLRFDPQLDLRPNASYTWVDEYLERARGFLFLNGVYEIQGPESFSILIRQLRTRNYGDQDLLRALTQQGPTEKQPQMRQLVCQSFIGVRNLSCAQ
jgi:hypothetical protein